MEGLIGAVIILGGLIWLTIAVADRVRGRFGKGRGLDPSGFGESAPRLVAIYGIAARLEAFAAVVAHPDDLGKHKDFGEGVVILSADTFTDDEVLAYATGGNAMLAAMALRALVQRNDSPEAKQRIVAALGTMARAPFHFALAFLRSAVDSGEQLIAQVLKHSTGVLWDPAYRASLAEFVAWRLADGEPASLTGVFQGWDEYTIGEIRRLLESVNSPEARTLIDQLPGTGAGQPPDALAAIGSVWDGRAAGQAQFVVEHEELKATVDEIEQAFLAIPARSALIIGEHGVGKTAAVVRVGARLFDRGWTVFVAGHGELMAGQIYIGQFEERLRNLVQNLRAQPNTLWIIPGFEALAFSGRHHFSTVSALDTLLPSIEQGEIRVIAEMSLSAYEQLIPRQPRIAAALGIHRIEPLDAGSAIAVAGEWLKRRGGWRMTPGALEEAAQLAQHFQGDLAAPGTLMRVLRLTVQRLERSRSGRKGRDVGVDDVIETLGELSGLPAAILDERETLDLDALRQFFHRRVVGQDEAISCLVERVAMIKAGVTDPTRPAGVFLFAGPTGTGKTEIVKTLAEWLFGSPDRLIRLDMSELQTPQSLDRLIGTEEGGGGALTDMVREQPFSIILLDEFEKANPNVWDLFLQVFDDGRLTDRRGRRADFRHTILVLTSNLGAVVPTGLPMGFGSVAEEFEPEGVARAIEQTFRKEFVNRIDRVVVFRPLSRDVMRAILQNEIDAAFRRRGLRSRSWAVEWDESALAFLLDRGFRPDLGARPLKRALDQYLVAPLALTIVNRQVPAGDQFLFITRKDDGLEVEFVDPDAPTFATASATDGPGSGAVSLRSILLQPTGSSEEYGFLRTRLGEMKTTIEGEKWRDEKAACLSMLDMPGFWQSPERFEILGAAEYIDRIEAAARGVGSLLGRLGRRGNGTHATYPATVIATAAQTLFLLEIACADVWSARPREAYLLVESVRHSQAGGDGADLFADRIAHMYLAWAKARRMKSRTLEARNGTGGGYRCLLAIGGLGAHTLLCAETGLHVLESAGRENDKAGRVTVRVQVVPQPPEPPGPGADDVRRQALDALADGDARSRRIVRRYRETPSPLVRDTARGWRTGRFDSVLAGDFDLFE